MIQITDEKGQIEGWVVALGETALVYGLITLAFFYKPAKEAWPVMGPYIQTIFPLSLGIWFAYKSIEVIKEVIK